MTKIIGISGFSGSGKTTLIDKLIGILKEKGLTVAVIKHVVSGVKFGEKDTDRYIIRKADFVAGIFGEGIIMYKREQVSLRDLLKKIGNYDIVLIEGFKYEDFPKIFILKGQGEKDEIEFLKEYKKDILCFAGKKDLNINNSFIKGPMFSYEGNPYIKYFDKNLPFFNRDDGEKIAEFIINEI
ncbi:molybdopterin-guanine dinucleotide biosynthesis protein B [Thermovenabulum gondwanense]|uniref:Molybdopterin-guanine dinucleotide biosynthesis adapter protein n=1 Tax=Thermovenabulum gondwanense TaxID=520767 RepID=A0A161QAB6_9FIRM|nr:molybdopterin-guanine dinucleotide biosynthesis protein B [Thermovenabulum gondwanense]KYO65277.1 Molybdopterin-guanine dinucleotide biosynthesis adapter protein [Thermovenabulum gondwanense]